MDDLPSRLGDGYNKLLEDVSGVFEDEEIGSEALKDGNQFLEENDKTYHQHRHEDCEEVDKGIDTSFISFPADASSSNYTKGHQYSHMGNSSSEDDRLYDETDLKQEYEPVNFSE